MLPRRLRVGGGELTSRRLVFEQLDDLGEKRPPAPGFTAKAMHQREADHRRAYSQGVPLLAQLGNRFLVSLLGLGEPPADPGGLGCLSQYCRALRLPGRKELKRPPVVGLGPADVERERPIARHDEEATGGELELPLVLGGASRACEVERLSVVVRKDLRVVSDTVLSDVLDPLRRRFVPSRSSRSRDLMVGDIPYQEVPEGELVLAFDG